jgi:crotonobetainyl-CoA:carnitine CoA-transferase CaiB-like acyl-CoA transferase
MAERLAYDQSPTDAHRHTARDDGATTAADAELRTLENGALDGLRVIEMGSMLAGPLCARFLADHGADVIKIEDPARGDVGRSWGRNKLEGRSLWWPIQARNKRCITINLRTNAGQGLARRLLADADILVENFRPGTLERWGLGPDDLRTTNPGLIMVRVSGFGQTGPARERAGFGVVGEAIGGLRFVTGYPDQPPPRVGVSIGDELASVFGFAGALLALRARELTGDGQVVDVAIYEAVFAMMESLATEYAALGVVPERTGSRIPGVAPSDIYPTREGDWVVIAANADNVFRRLMEVMGHGDLADDPRFATHDARGRHHGALDELIATWSRERATDDIVGALEAAGVPACKIYSPADMVADPHFWARDMLVKVLEPTLGELTVPGVMPKLSDSPGAIRWLGPEHGEHNAAVLGQELGIDEEQLARWRAEGVV